MPGVVSRRVGCEVMMEKRMEEGGLGTVEVVVGGRRLVSSRWLIHGDFLKIGSCKAPRLEKARGDWQPTSRGSNLSEVPLGYICFLRDTASSPVHPQSSSKNTSRG